MGAAYRFLDRWLVPAPTEDVYDVIGDILSCPTRCGSGWK